jgi:hypothetical protein
MQSKKQWLRALACAPALVFALHLPAQAGMIGPEGAVTAPAPDGAAQDRAKVQQFLDRAGVAERLQALGVDALAARDRVDAMSDAEVHALAQRMDAMPAGGSLSQNDLILVLLIAILVALLL